MTKKQISFFATHVDLTTMVRDAVKTRPVKFVLAGFLDDPCPQILDSIDDLRSFTSYLVLDEESLVEGRQVKQRDGSYRYAVDQVGIPNSTVLHTGGISSEQQLVAGQIGTVGATREAIALYDIFLKTIRKRFEKIKSYYVGSEAAAMLDRGVRLSATIKAPAAYDLVR